MASWNIPSSVLTGDVLPESWLDDVQGDLEVLATNVGLFGVGAAADGSAPFATAPNFLIQAGSTVVAVSGSGEATIGFPAAFSGVLTIVATYGGAIPSTIGPLALDSISTEGFNINAQNADGGDFRINWIAIGF